MSMGEHERDPIVDRLNEAADVLEAVARDRGLLAALTPEERTRLLNAAGDVFNPDVGAAPAAGARPSAAGRRRRSSRATRRCSPRPASACCARSRCSRRRTSSRPTGFEQADVDGRPRVPRGRRAAALLRLQAALPRDPPLLRPALPGVRRLQLRASARETADLRGRVALLTGGRVKIGYQAGIKLLRAGAHLIVTTRFPRDSAARYARGAGLRRLGRPARDLRARSAPHAERRGVLPAPASRRATGSTSSSTTPARPCGGRPTSTRT